MLTLYTFGPYFGLPDASPFCIKALCLMKMSGLPHTVERMNFRNAPKGKAPYLADGPALIADSHFIMRQLEQEHGCDFSGGYDAKQLAVGWALARMMEEHLYFLSIGFRWLEDANFWKGPYQFFSEVPALLRPLVARIVRNKTRKTQMLQGLGRHSRDEKIVLACGDIDAVEAIMGENQYVLGDQVCGVDATVFSFLWASSIAYFESPVGDYIRSRPKLMNYLARMEALYFPSPAGSVLRN